MTIKKSELGTYCGTGSAEMRRAPEIRDIQKSNRIRFKMAAELARTGSTIEHASAQGQMFGKKSVPARIVVKTSVGWLRKGSGGLFPCSCEFAFGRLRCLKEGNELADANNNE